MTVINPPPIFNGTVPPSGFFEKLTTSLYQLWFAMGGQGKGIFPPTLTDALAEKGTLYYSSTASKLVFKDSAGVVHALY